MQSSIRAQFELFANLIKNNYKIDEALRLSSIQNLQSVCENLWIPYGQKNAINVEQSPHVYAEKLTNTAIKEAIDTFAENRSDRFGCSSETVEKAGVQNSSKFGEVNAESIFTKEIGTIDVVLKEFSDSIKKNLLEDLIDWLLSEAEYCFHALLLSNGKVLVDSTGNVDKKFLWAPPGHCSLPFNSLNLIVQRSAIAMETLDLLLKFSTPYLPNVFVERYRDIMAMKSIASGDTENQVKNSEICVKSFCDIIPVEKGERDMYLLVNGLPGYVEALQRLIENVEKSHWNLNILSVIQDASSMICDITQMRGMVDNLAAARCITDIRVINTYVSILHKAFENLKFPDKMLLMQYFYEQHGVPQWQDLDENLEKDLTLAINGLCVQNRTKDYIQKLANVFSWFFLLSFKFTWWKLLQSVLRMPAIIPVLIEVLRLLYPVTEFRLKDNAPRLVLVGIRRLLDERQVTTQEHEINWMRLIVASISVQKCGLPASPAIVPVINATECFSAVILPVLSSRPRLGVTTILSLLGNGSVSNIKWWSETMPQPSDGFVSISIVLTSIFDIVANATTCNDTLDPELAKQCLEAVQLLITVWENDGILSTNEVNQLEHRFKHLPWLTRCLIQATLRMLSKYTIQIGLPQCFFDVFQLPVAKYRPLLCEDSQLTNSHSPFSCALAGLFRIANVSVEIAIDIICDSNLEMMLTKMKEDGELKKAILNALVMALPSIQDWRVCAEVFLIIFDGLKEADAQVDEMLCVKSYSIGLRMTAMLGMLCHAVIDLIDKTPRLAHEYVRKFSMVAKDVIIDRVNTLDDQLAKYVALETSFINFCWLTSNLKIYSSEMLTLLLNTLEYMTNIGGDTYTTLLECAISCLEGQAKILLMKKLHGEEKCSTLI